MSMIPKNAKKIPLRPLALGEATGHSHRLICETGPVEEACELYEHVNNGITEHFLLVTREGVSLIHAAAGSTQTADHYPHVIAPGEHRVTIQEETTDWGTRKMTD
jgi:hypothetical protein